jgi:hypothetical protein
MNSLELLAQKGWIKLEEPLWWDLTISKKKIVRKKHDTKLKTLKDYALRQFDSSFNLEEVDEIRKFMSFKQFENSLTPLNVSGVSLNVSFTDYIPVTLTKANLFSQSVDLLVSCRPIHIQDLEDFFPELASCTSKEQISDSLSRLAQEQDGWPNEYKDMFRPHIRGFFKEKRNNTIIYYPLRKDLDEQLDISKQIITSLPLAKKYLHVLSHKNSPEIKVTNTSDELLRSGLILGDKNYRDGELFKITNAQLHKKSFPQAQFTNFETLLKRESPSCAYMPIKINTISKSIPVLISNRDLEGNKGFFAYGVYFQNHHSDFSEHVNFFPFADTYQAKKINQQLVNELNVDFKTYYYKKITSSQREKKLLAFQKEYKLSKTQIKEHHPEFFSSLKSSYTLAK